MFGSQGTQRLYDYTSIQYTLLQRWRAKFTVIRVSLDPVLLRVLHLLTGHSTRPHSLSSASDHQPNMYQTQQVSSKIVASDSGDHVRVVHSRPKPQCWEHGCNGRQFSTFSNLLRHQREKSGAAAKSTCPNCGAEFTRTTARNGHMAHEKCKQRRNS